MSGLAFRTVVIFAEYLEELPETDEPAWILGRQYHLKNGRLHLFMPLKRLCSALLHCFVQRAEFLGNQPTARNVRHTNIGSQQETYLGRAGCYRDEGCFSNVT